MQDMDKLTWNRWSNAWSALWISHMRDDTCVNPPAATFPWLCNPILYILFPCPPHSTCTLAPFAFFHTVPLSSWHSDRQCWLPAYFVSPSWVIALRQPRCASTRHMNLSIRGCFFFLCGVSEVTDCCGCIARRGFLPSWSRILVVADRLGLGGSTG